jgi:hypothetical protein
MTLRLTGYYPTEQINAQDFQPTLLSGFKFLRHLPTGYYFDSVREAFIETNELHELEFPLFTPKIDPNEPAKVEEIDFETSEKIKLLNYINKPSIKTQGIPVHNLNNRTIMEVNASQYTDSFKKVGRYVVTDLEKNIKRIRRKIEKLTTADNAHSKYKLDEKLRFLSDEFIMLPIHMITITRNRDVSKAKKLAKTNEYVVRNNCEPGFSQISRDLMHHLGGVELWELFKVYVKLGYIECDGKYFNSEAQGKAYGYKISDEFKLKINKPKCKDTIDPHVRFNILRFRHKHCGSPWIETTDPFRNEITDKAKELVYKINTDEMKKFVEQQPCAYYDVNDKKELRHKLLNADTVTIEQDIVKLTEIKDTGYMYGNRQDSYSGRFHSVFTNTRKIIRNFIKYDDGQRAVSIDISNSQMVGLTTIIAETDKVRHILEDNNVPTHSINRLNMIKEIVEDNRADGLYDADTFIELSRKGEIYEYVAEALEIDRTEAKTTLFAALFSEKSTWQEHNAKTHIRKLFPTMVEIADKLNVNGKSYVPRLCQTLEVSLFIDNIMKDFFKVSKYPSTPIHDSVLLHPSDEEAFMNVYNDVFTKYGLEPFLTKREDLNETMKAWGF